VRASGVTVPPLDARVERGRATYPEQITPDIGSLDHVIQPSRPRRAWRWFTRQFGASAGTDPAEIGPVVDDLLAKAETPTPVYGT